MSRVIKIGLVVLFVAGILGRFSYGSIHTGPNAPKTLEPSWTNDLKMSDLVPVCQACEQNTSLALPKDYGTHSPGLVFVEYVPGKAPKRVFFDPFYNRYIKLKKDSRFTLFVMNKFDEKTMSYIYGGVGHTRFVRIWAVEMPEKKILGSVLVAGKSPPWQYEFLKGTKPPDIVYGEKVPREKIVKTLEQYILAAW